MPNSHRGERSVRSWGVRAQCAERERLPVRPPPAVTGLCDPSVWSSRVSTCLPLRQNRYCAQRIPSVVSAPFDPQSHNRSRRFSIHDGDGQGIGTSSKISGKDEAICCGNDVSRRQVLQLLEELIGEQVDGTREPAVDDHAATKTLLNPLSLVTRMRTRGVMEIHGDTVYLMAVGATGEALVQSQYTAKRRSAARLPWKCRLTH